MRRLILFALLACLIASPVAAQQNLNVYPGGIINIAPTAVTIGNTGTATNMYSVTVPASFSQNLRGTKPGATALHLSMFGTISTQSANVGPANLGCSYGGTTASIALVNGSTFTAALSAVPWSLDLWVRVQGTGEVVLGRFLKQTAATTTVPYMATVVGTTATTAPQVLKCVFQWASVTATNTLTINNATLAIDN